MASTTDFASAGGRGSAAAGLAHERDRTRAFRRAWRHTVLVRALRIMLPVLSLAIVAYYGVTMQLAIGLEGLTIPEAPRIEGDKLTMDKPRYEGFNKDGSRFVVTARTARQEVMSRSAPILLSGIDGELIQPNKAMTRLRATSGTFDHQASVLDLYDGIDVASESGLRAALTRARVLTKEGTIQSQEPVYVEMPAGHIRANAMMLKQKTRHVTFSSGVAARLNPQARQAVEGKQATAAKAPQGLGRRDVPVDVTAQRLVVDDAAKAATFQGGVRASQNGSLLETEELQIAYVGQPALPGGQPAAKAPGADAASSVRSITAPTPVVLTQGQDRVTARSATFDVPSERARLDGEVRIASGNDRRASADAAELDQKAETILLTGGVHLVQARNEMRGTRLWLDRKHNKAQLTAPGSENGRIWARFVQPNAGRAPRNGKSEPAGGSNDLLGAFGGASFKADPDAPVVIDANSLDVDDGAKTAVFRGDVQAAQDTFKVRTKELTAHYSGGSGLAMAAAGTASAPREAARLTKIEARKGVVVTGKDGQKAEGEWADFDVKANTVVLGGNVVLSQCGNVLRGSKLDINLTTGQYRLLESAKVRGAPTVSGSMPANGPGLPEGFARSLTGRPSAVFYPGQFRKDKSKGQGGEAAAAKAALAGGCADKPGQPGR